MIIKENLVYTKEHEWVKVEGNIAYVGITDFAQHALGDIVFVDLPEADDEFAAGDAFGAVESVKAASDVYLPLAGVIIEINEELIDNPGIINENPYENWFVKIEISDEGELTSLLNAKDYEALCSEEE